jgi:hypothetical protein
VGAASSHPEEDTVDGLWATDAKIEESVDTVAEALHRLSDGKIRTSRTGTRSLVLDYPGGLRVRLVAEDATRDNTYGDDLRGIRRTAHRLVERIGRLGERMHDGLPDEPTSRALQSMAIARGSLKIVLAATTKAIRHLGRVGATSSQHPEGVDAKKAT